MSDILQCRFRRFYDLFVRGSYKALYRYLETHTRSEELRSKYLNALADELTSNVETKLTY